MFQKAIELFNVFKAKSFQKNRQIDAQAAELGNKIAQLQWLVDYARSLNNKFLASIEAQLDLTSMFELEIITESFYHFAWRIVEISKHIDDLDEIKKTKVGQVRNYLIQHPETQKGRAKFHPEFAVRGKAGPVIKSYSGPHDSFDDEGLFYNAEEFNIKLCIVLERAIDKL